MYLSEDRPQSTNFLFVGSHGSGGQSPACRHEGPVRSRQFHDIFGGKISTGTDFLRIFLLPAPSLLFLKSSIVHLHVTLIRRTKGRSLETIQKLLLFRISISMDKHIKLFLVVILRTRKTNVNMTAACISDILWASHHDRARNTCTRNGRVKNAHACYTS